MVVAVDKLILEVEARTKEFDNKMRNMQNLLLGMGLSFLFTGMSIKRFFQTMLQSLLETFMLVEGETGPVNEKINELRAAIEYAKWSLMDAAKETGLFDSLTNKIQKAVDWFNSLSEGTKSFIVTLMVLGFVAGTVMMFIGGLLLFLLGPLALLKFMGVGAFIS